jgi:hypothetical protein
VLVHRIEENEAVGQDKDTELRPAA